MASVDKGITVIFTDGEVGDVQRYMLDRLIREKRIVAFLRISGWVDADGDTIRKSSTTLGNRWSDEFLSERRES
jgi:hypothetical protein